MITALREEVQSLKRQLESQGDGNDTWKAMVQNCICSARSQLSVADGNDFRPDPGSVPRVIERLPSFQSHGETFAS